MQMTQREEFEKWFKHDFHPDKTGPYVKDQLWFAWQASREAMNKTTHRRLVQFKDY